MKTVSIADARAVEDYERLRTGVVQAFLELRNEVAGEAIAAGLTEERLSDLLNENDRLTW
jgi:hypothetical protein